MSLKSLDIELKLYFYQSGTGKVQRPTESEESSQNGRKIEQGLLLGDHNVVVVSLKYILNLFSKVFRCTSISRSRAASGVCKIIETNLFDYNIDYYSFFFTDLLNTS